MASSQLNLDISTNSTLGPAPTPDTPHTCGQHCQLSRRHISRQAEVNARSWTIFSYTGR